MTSYANKLCGALARTFSVLIGSNVQSSVVSSILSAFIIQRQTLLQWTYRLVDLNLTL